MPDAGRARRRSGRLRVHRPQRQGPTTDPDRWYYPTPPRVDAACRGRIRRGFSDIAELVEVGLSLGANGTPIREIVGADPVEFVEAFVQNYPEGQWRIRERERLNRTIALLDEGRIIVNGTLAELQALLPPATVEYAQKQPTLEDVFLALVGGPDTHADPRRHE